ncbi:MAG: CRISPR-associated helicase Cas3' [Clostridiaceae bacterium]|nr:CRISPR-associated helicase Cas3' [Clostridiaceae bacterium]
MYIAHKRDDGEIHPLISHLKSTAIIAEEFAKPFKAEKYAYACGLLHDIGKYSYEFQNRIKNNGKHCDHSTAGAREALKLGNSGKLLAYCIAGHHAGLQNAGFASDTGNEATLASRFKKKIPDYSNAFDEINLPEINIPKMPNIKGINKFGFSLSFFIRMIYSCLVDADFLDTECFMSEGKVDRRSDYSFDLFLDSLNREIDEFKKKENNEINYMRNRILLKCIQKSNHEKGLFILSVPTGGGKTISSMAFAINHLLNNKMSRIIYVIPYTSIIEQNAKEFKDIIGGENVLEHHSNFDFSDDEEEVNNKLKLSSENWDIPVIVTTNVQFFESVFSNKPSRCRKLHNIANSVIIFDEAQMLPAEYLIPCTMAISELVANYNSTVVLCTATQPALDQLFPKCIRIREICEYTDEEKKLLNIFKRTKIIKREELNLRDLADELNERNQVLCIVNTRRHALELYSKLKKDGSYHLSTLMCPVHRREVISKIKVKLKTGQPCRVASTQLIEAGVNIDFPVVYRSIAGLDSIVQAAGRCNREGELKDENGNKILGEVHVFTPEKKFVSHQPYTFKRRIEVTKGIIRRHDDIFSVDAIYEYFKELYEVSGEEGLDIKGIYKDLESGVHFNGTKPQENFNFDFENIAKEFKLIEDDTVPIIIPYSKDENDNAARELIEKLKFTEKVGGILRSLQGYTVNVYKPEFDWLFSLGIIEPVKKNIFVLTDMSSYDSKTGLKIDKEIGIGIYV